LLLVVAGQSHSMGYMRGLIQLENLDPNYDINYTAEPETYTDQHLRISRTTWGDVNNATGWINDYGEEDWFASAPAIEQTKTGINYYNSLGIPMSAFGFGWCWNTIDGPYIDDYIAATKDYIAYCTTNNIPTKIFFTTPPVDGVNMEGETGWNIYQYSKQVRDTVLAIHQEYCLIMVIFFATIMEVQRQIQLRGTVLLIL
jgi:hypothetical protein